MIDRKFVSTFHAVLKLSILCAAASVTRAQQPFCLHDANGDRHPLFGNPEVMLNPFDDLMGWTSTVPTWGAIGDLDGDGDLDAVATYAREQPVQAEQSSLVVLLNAGDGVFHSDARYDCGDYPGSVAIGDLNEDGLNDVAVTNTYSGQVSVLLNTGAGHFSTRVGYDSGCLPRSVVIADLNGDGHLDIAVLNAGTDDVAVFAGAGNGAFTHMASYPALDIPEDLIDFDNYSFGGPHLSAGDIDGDGDIDLVVPGEVPSAGPYGVGVLVNDGQAGFGPPLPHGTGGFPWSNAIGDLDGDGDADIIAPNPTSEHSTVAVLLNLGGANFAPHADYTVEYAGPGGWYGPRSVALGDIDEDGDRDVVVGLLSDDPTYDDIVTLQNDGAGTFSAPVRHAADQEPRVVALGDFNDDGHIDVAAFTFRSQWARLCVLTNDGTGSLVTDRVTLGPDSAPASPEWCHTSEARLADFDADGDPDIAVLNAGYPGVASANVVILRNLGQGTFDGGVEYDVPAHSPKAMVTADMDGDSFVDIVVCGPENPSIYTPGRVSLLRNQGGGAFATPVSYLTGGTQTDWMDSGDVDGDGDVDVVVSSYYSNSISVLLNNGDGTLTAPIVQTLPGLWPGSVAVGDINDDLVPDLVATTEYPQRVFLMFGVGDGTFTLGPLYSPSSTVGRVALADFDGDGDLDLVVSSNNLISVPVTITVLRNQGDGTFSEPAQYWSPGTHHASALTLADVDSDGDIDIAVSTNDCVSVFLNRGDGVFAAATAYGAGRGTGSGSAGDLNGDGDVDAVFANVTDENVSVFWNRSCRTGPPGDLDGNGNVDLLDWLTLASCLTGPTSPGVPGTCIVLTDLDGDADTDLRDCAEFAVAFTGP